VHHQFVEEFVQDAETIVLLMVVYSNDKSEVCFLYQDERCLVLKSMDILGIKHTSIDLPVQSRQLFLDIEVGHSICKEDKGIDYSGHQIIVKVFSEDAEMVSIQEWWK
ncbi:11119_t:CDS:1, partial [Paraglomus brasilianum]